MKSTGFEMPAEMRALAEQSIETARKAFQGYLNASEQVLGMVASSTGASEAARDLGRKAMGYAQENVIDSFAFIDKLMHARDVDEVVRLQSEFAESQAKKLTDQTRVLGEAAAKAMSETKPRG
ncbi:MAG TPA: phasin family protein [Xanthobacteraceae bacterium]|jgi:phasin